MKLEVKRVTEEELEFTLSDTTVAFANALRRVAMSHIPVFGIDTVTFYENESALFDEYIANRIGLVPITTPEGYTDKDVVLFSLDKEGPGMVYSESLKSSDDKVGVANTDIPIIKLGEGQHLRLEAKARLGTGREHAKFQAGLVTYEMDPSEKGTFHFRIESFGQLSAKEMLAGAVRVLGAKLEELDEKLKKVGKD